MSLFYHHLLGSGGLTPDLNAAILHAYTMNEVLPGDEAEDIVSGFNGDVNGSINVVTGDLSGSAYEFTESQYIILDNILNNPTGGFDNPFQESGLMYVSMLYQTTRADQGITGNILFSLHDGSGGNVARCGSTDTGGIFIRSTGGSSTSQRDNWDTNDGEWKQVVFRFEPGTTGSAGIDAFGNDYQGKGVAARLDWETADFINLAVDAFENGKQVTIAMEWDGGSASDEFGGKIDSVLIAADLTSVSAGSNRTISDFFLAEHQELAPVSDLGFSSQITAAYALNDVSNRLERDRQGRKPGKIQGTATYTAGDVTTDALVCDGTSTWMDMAMLVNGVYGNPYTGSGQQIYVSIIFRTTRSGHAVSENMILSTHSSSGNNQMRISVTTTGGLYIAVDGDTATVETGWNLNDGNWKHVVIEMFDDPGNSIRAYGGRYNSSGTGALSSLVQSVTEDSGLSDGFLMSLGQEYDSGPTPSDFFDGDIDSVVVADTLGGVAGADDVLDFFFDEHQKLP